MALNLLKLLEEKKVLVSDGAWGTEMFKRGIKAGQCPELLNEDEPGVIASIARTYVLAGSDIILTNTFGGSPLKLAKYGAESRTEEINAKGTALSKAEAGTGCLVFASMGPTGEFLEPLGDISQSELTELFARQVAGFVKGGADAVIIETMSDVGEALCAVKSVKENSDLPVICSMTFEKGAKRTATMMGTTPAEAVEKLLEGGADYVGANCGAGIDQMIEIAVEMNKVSSRAIWFKANAGLPELVDGQAVFRETPDYMASRVPALIEAGARIIGGCCGSTPDHIRAFRKIVDSL